MFVPVTSRIMPLRRFFLSMVVVLVAALPVAAHAQADSASAFIRNLGDQAITTLRDQSITMEQREAKLRKILHDRFDIPFIGRWVLGRYWREASPSQRQAYLATFSEYILKTYSRRLGGYADETLAVVSETPAGDSDTIVRTNIERPGASPIVADWRVRRKDGHYRIIDVMISGVSMAATQRSEFGSVVRQNGIDGLINILQTHNDKVTATASPG